MNCPSCYFENGDNARFCGRCRLRFSPTSLFLARFREDVFWIFRRANAGFLSGVVAWFFIPALSRVLTTDSSATYYFALEGLLGGAFLGTVDGMVEESTPKTLLGAFVGGLAGVVAGAVFGHFSDGLTPQQTVTGLFCFWAFTGAGIGVVSALWERRPKKLIFGILAGLAGGGIGGGLRYAIYAYLVDTFSPHSWILRRGTEGFTGGLMGVTLWFSIALAERFVIFQRRRLEEGRTYKNCDRCRTHNALTHWYCSSCGSVLQEAAAPGALHLSPYQTLDRLASFLQFLNRLSATAGVIAGIVVFIVLAPVNVMLAIVATVLVAILSYGCQAMFSALSESLRIYTTRS